MYLYLFLFLVLRLVPYTSCMSYRGIILEMNNYKRESNFLDGMGNVGGVYIKFLLENLTERNHLGD
jgi:hypothetical protein